MPVVTQTATVPNLAQLMQKQCLTAIQLARMSNVSSTTISRACRGTAVSFRVIRALAGALSVSTDMLRDPNHPLA